MAALDYYSAPQLIMPTGMWRQEILGRFEPQELSTVVAPADTTIRGLSANNIIIDEANDVFSSTNVQDAINAISTGLEWRDDGVYANGERLTAMWDSDIVLTVSDSTTLNTKITNSEVEELRNRVADLEEEIALLKMKFMEN